MGGSRDCFTTYNPITNFIFFIGAIVMGMVFRHPLFSLCSLAAALIYYFTIKKEKGIKFFSFMMVILVVLTFINPLFNSYGSHRMFTILGHPYYFEALANGASIGAMVVTVMVWFACYNSVMTSDKFIYIFGRLMPAISLVLSMALRLVPLIKNKYTQISTARKCIGRSAESLKGMDKLKNGMTELSVLTSWAMEGGIITADSMKCRGYGSGKRTAFAVYRFGIRNGIILGIMAVLIAAVVICTVNGAAAIEFYPEIRASKFDNVYLSIGLACYFLFLMIPSLLNIKEAIIWHILKSKI